MIHDVQCDHIYFYKECKFNEISYIIMAKIAIIPRPSVVVLQTTAGWRKAPALAQRVCTRGLASPRSISPKNTMNTARFRVVRAAGA